MSERRTTSRHLHRISTVAAAQVGVAEHIHRTIHPHCRPHRASAGGGRRFMAVQQVWQEEVDCDGGNGGTGEPHQHDTLCTGLLTLPNV